MKVLICWSYISGYMAACWRSLAQTGQCDVHVLAQAAGGAKDHSAFNAAIMQGVPCTLVGPEQTVDDATVRRVIAEQKPDIIVINGWHTPSYRKIPELAEARGCKFVMAMDTPYLGTIRQKLGRFAMRGFFSKIDRVFVTGERCWQLAKVLGFPERIIRRGVYGVDYDLLSPLHQKRSSLPAGWPLRFVTTGRYVNEKGLDVLVDGYRQYRKLVEDPWGLSCCGRGPLASMLRAVEGVQDHGFIQPGDLPAVLVQHGAFVLASRFDPWPLVIVEACAAGLPIVCSEACGSRVELVRDLTNGITFPSEDAQGLRDALLWTHHNHASLPEMGRISKDLAAGYTAQMWSRRWLHTFHELMPSSSRT